MIGTAAAAADVPVAADRCGLGDIDLAQRVVRWLFDWKRELVPL
jgi:hypothetical protein